MIYFIFFREFEIKEGENGTILLNRHLKTKASYDKSIIKQLNKGMFDIYWHSATSDTLELNV